MLLNLLILTQILVQLLNQLKSTFTENYFVDILYLVNYAGILKEVNHISNYMYLIVLHSKVITINVSIHAFCIDA